jgi:hypothetical protein
VKDSSEMAEKRVGKTLEKVKARVEKKRGDWHDEGKKAVREGSDGIDAALGKEWASLASDVSHCNASTLQE